MLLSKEEIEAVIDDFGMIEDLKEIRKDDMEDVKSPYTRTYFEDLTRAEPEASIIEVFRKVFSSVDLTNQIKIGKGNADFLIRTSDNSSFILEFKKYLMYDSSKRILEAWPLNPFLNTREMLDVKDQIFNYLSDPNATWEYLILTNFQEWYFYSRSDLTTRRRVKPFARWTLKEVNERFGDAFTIQALERLEIEEDHRDLGEQFFDDVLIQKYLLLFSWAIHNRLFDDMVRQLGISS